MIAPVTIRVRNVGQSFGCEGVVKRGNKVLHVTRVFPHGMRANAYAEAERHAHACGWPVTEQL